MGLLTGPDFGIDREVEVGRIIASCIVVVVVKSRKARERRIDRSQKKQY